MNKTSTRVTLRWNVGGSMVLGPRQRARLLERLSRRLTAEGDLVVHAGRRRSRARNRELAREQLASLVRDALRIETPRVATRPTRASRERRLESKQRRSDVKRSRRSVRVERD